MKQQELWPEPTRDVEESPPLPKELVEQLMNVMATAILAVIDAGAQESTDEPVA